MVSPEKLAVTKWVPAPRVADEARLATPPTSATGDPKALPSTRNWTVPVGIAWPIAAARVAVKVTVWP